MYSRIWFDQLATHHEVTFIPDDLLFIQPELRELSPAIQLDLDRYILIETYQPIEVIQEEIDAYKQFVKYMNTEYDVDVVFLPLNIGDDGSDPVEVSGVVSFNELGTQGMFAGIIMGLLATEVFMKLANNKKLSINLGDQVPPAVGQGFSTMIPTIVTLSFFAIISALLSVVFHTDLVTLISTLIQEPLRAVNSSIFGYLLIYSTGNFLFTLGIHQSVINGVLTDPLLLVNMNENMNAVANGQEPMNIINSSFQAVYAQMGGTGGTLALIIAVFLVSKYQPYREVSKLSIAPGLFEINEPMIFGLPIIFNIPMMIPFVLSPVIGALIGYIATVVGFVEPLIVLVPWTTPPLISGFLASGGDLKVVLLQIIILAVTTLFYIPFLKISERVAIKQAEIEQGKNEGNQVEDDDMDWTV
ncbi:PTS sugar transporter subunit IIC [Aerococcus urinaeequi]|uniref:PTS sugar transporter subunit IIC n=1 Tax=Aerococcus urinaeequi TaxID=51665 RepID=UPI0028921C78|nr:PTS transporter subunit EIIC [Aerococcus urinaeequi]MDT2762131.1 PTS transporter subunit EIIC [Aerococcus urinaeequi]